MLPLTMQHRFPKLSITYLSGDSEALFLSKGPAEAGTPWFDESWNRAILSAKLTPTISLDFWSVRSPTLSE